MTWIPDLGIGHCPVAPPTDLYGQSYWDEYVKRSQTEMGQRITRIRCELVERWLVQTAPVLDIGIGCGQFVEMRELQYSSPTYGYDVNPLGLTWLAKRDRYREPHDGCHDMTFWDALEHIPDASRVMGYCRNIAFVTLPIFRDEGHCRESRHFKPGEHVWYFTRDGLIRWCRGLGFRLLEHNTMETQLGREDIETFVFKRVVESHA